MDHMKTDTCHIDWSFIEKAEGCSKQGYVPCDKKGNVIGNSGCTVACGFDIGNQSVSSMTSYGFSSDLLRKLLPYTDKKSDYAKTFLAKYPLYLDDEEVAEINGKVHKKFEAYITKLYNDHSDFRFEFLKTAQQTVIMSVAYQYGDIKGKCPTFFKLVTGGLWNKVVEELRNFGDDYKSRRNKEADLLESSL